MLQRERGCLLVWVMCLAPLLSGCGPEAVVDATDRPERRIYEWKMVTTWLPNFPGLGTGINRMVSEVARMSDGRLRIKVYGAGELVKAFGVLDAVKTGVAQMGHGASYYWSGKLPAAIFFTSVPFGLTAQEMNAWLYHGGGLDLWREIYGKHNLYPVPGGNTGVQMAGWFRKPVNSMEDFRGVRMRMPGIGGEVLRRAGGISVSLPGDEVFVSLQTGALDAAEWVGPYNDLALGLHTVASYYYYPGWHEPGPTLEAIVNLDAWNELPEDLQAILENALRVMNEDILAEFTANNYRALKELVDKHDVQLRRLPEDVLIQLKRASQEVLEELASDSPEAARVWESFRTFLRDVRRYHEISEKAYLQVRDLPVEPDAER